MGKGASVIGTPYHRIGTSGTAHEGMRAGEPKGFDGKTVHSSYGHQDERPGAGTPYHSREGNGPEARRVASHGSHGGIVLSENGQNMNDPKSNGNGVIFDGVSREHGMRAGAQPHTLDSPVPAGAQKPIQDAPRVLNDLRSGEGSYFGANDGPNDSIIEQGGVLSRGIEGTSHHDGSETELVEDDVLRNLGRGGAVG